jgi:hypothetical protein
MKPARAILASVLVPAALLFMSCSRETTGSSRPSSATTRAAAIQAVVSFVAGDVTAGIGTQKTAVRIGDTVSTGQSLKTGARSECTLQLGDRATIRIAENTQLLLDEVVLDAGRSSVGLRAVVGAVLCKVGKLSGDERFRVVTPTAVVGVRGTEFSVAVSAGGDTVLEVQQGSVAILPASIDLETLAAGLKADDPEVSAAFAELGNAELIVQDGQKAQVTATAYTKAGESSRRVQKAIAAISGRKQPTAAEKQAFLAAMKKAAAEISTSMVPRTSKPAPAPAPVSKPVPQPVVPEHDTAHPVPIQIFNDSFEYPSEETGPLAATDDWACGGTWYGRSSIPGAAQDQSISVWASYRSGGSGNGYSQELASRYAVGHYTLSVWINGDARGLESLAVLGYVSGSNGYRVIGSSARPAPYGLAAGTAWKSSWVEQKLDIEILEESPAVGQPIWIRFTNTTAPAPKRPSDTDNYGDSVSWDHVTLTRFNYSGLGE